LNDAEIPVTGKITHLGVDRYSDEISPKQFIVDRISMARRTAYALMGTGCHGSNGISPQVSIQIYRTYVLPRLMYGLEAVVLRSSQISDMERFHRSSLRDLQSLPQRVASCAVYLLGGIPPLEALLDIQLANLLFTIGKAPSNCLLQVGLRQLSCKDSCSNSWFVYCGKRLCVYNLDAVELLLGRCYSSKAKTLILDYWSNQLKADATLKSTLRYLQADSCSIQNCHPVWVSTSCNPTETRQSIQKARLLTGTYTLQASKAVFNQYGVDPTCLLCGIEPEDRSHFLLRCPSLADVRQKHFSKLTDLYIGFSLLPDDDKVNLILDSNFSSTVGVNCDISDLEANSRLYIYSICCKRVKILNKL